MKAADQRDFAEFFARVNATMQDANLFVTAEELQAALSQTFEFCRENKQPLPSDVGFADFMRGMIWSWRNAIAAGGDPVPDFPCMMCDQMTRYRDPNAQGEFAIDTPHLATRCPRCAAALLRTLAGDLEATIEGS